MKTQTQPICTTWHAMALCYVAVCSGAAQLVNKDTKLVAERGLKEWGFWELPFMEPSPNDKLGACVAVKQFQNSSAAHCSKGVRYFGLHYRPGGVLMRPTPQLSVKTWGGGSLEGLWGGGGVLAVRPGGGGSQGGGGV